MTEQLMLFQESQEEKLERRMKDLEDKLDKMRKALFSKNANLNKMWQETLYDLETLKAAMCRTKT